MSLRQLRDVATPEKKLFAAAAMELKPVFLRPTCPPMHPEPPDLSPRLMQQGYGRRFRLAPEAHSREYRGRQAIAQCRAMPGDADDAPYDRSPTAQIKTFS